MKQKRQEKILEIAVYVDKFCEENGLKFIATKVGDRYVLERMLEKAIIPP